MRSMDAAVSGFLQPFDFRYDALGRRTFKRDNNLVDRFVYAGEDRVFAIQADTGPNVELDFTFVPRV